MLDIKKIQEYLPHRYPFLMVDRVLEVEENAIEAIKNVTINESFFQGHFPQDPIMPGVLLIEGLAQVGGILVIHQKQTQQSEENSQEYSMYFASIQGVKFRQPVRPGDQIHYHVQVLQKNARMAKLAGEVRVDGNVVAEVSQMTAMIVPLG